MSQTKVLHISGKENKDAKTQCRKGDSRDRCTPKKNEELKQFVERYDSAVAVVTGTINNLKEINENISEKIKEIEEYQTELARTRNGLDDTRLKNEQIIKNFSALIEV